jgi:hypothetical protein
VFDRLDPIPTSPPAALFRFDAATVLACLAGVALVVGLVTLVIERRSSRSSLPELLRHAT